jgi:uncharacterized protein (DUF2267 family)
MNFDHFVGQVQHRAQLPDTGAAVWAIQSTFQSLAEKLDPGEVKDLASQLPRPFHIYFDVDQYAQDFSVDEFFRRVSKREQEKAPVAAFHARVVLEVLQEAVSPGELQDVFDELPADWRRVFAAGSTGTLKLQNSRRTRTPEEKRLHPKSTLESLKAKARTRAETLKSPLGASTLTGPIE